MNVKKYGNAVSPAISKRFLSFFMALAKRKDLNAYERRVLTYLMGSVGFLDSWWFVSQKSICDGLSLKRSAVSRTLKSLAEKRVLLLREDNHAKCFSFNLGIGVSGSVVSLDQLRPAFIVNAPVADEDDEEFESQWAAARAKHPPIIIPNETLNRIREHQGDAPVTEDEQFASLLEKHAFPIGEHASIKDMIRGARRKGRKRKSA